MSATVEHASLLDWAKKILARHARGEPVAANEVRRARMLLAAHQDTKA